MPLFFSRVASATRCPHIDMADSTVMRLDDDPGISGVPLGPLRRRSVHVRCVDTGMVRVGDCIVHPGRTSPSHDCGRISEACRRMQSSPEKYVSERELRTVP